MARPSGTKRPRKAEGAQWPSGRETADALAWAELAADVAGAGYWSFDLASGTSKWSDGLFRLYGLEVGEVPDSETAWAAIHPEDRESIGRLHRRAIEFGEDYVDRGRLRRPDGSWRVLINRCVCKRDATGKVTSLFGLVMDITERELYRVLAENGNDCIVHSDLSGRITYVTPSVEAMTGFQPEELVGLMVTSVIEPEDVPALNLAFQDALKHPRGRGRCVEYRIRRKDGRLMWLESRPTALVFSASGKAIGATDVVRDITARKEAEDQLEQALAQALRLARFDGLTGLANRGVFVEALRHAIADAKRGGEHFAVIYLDLDRFKDVNDTLGHPVGDELLRAVADRLRSNTREADTIARFGGDEFAMIANFRDPTDLAIMADKLIKILADPFLIRGNQIYSGASIGIDVYGPQAADAETLLSHADMALYQAKSEGRGCYRFFTSVMDTEVRSRVALAAELHEAIAADQLFVQYQPWFDLGGGRITGVEALVRWRHPEHGVLGPALFIPVAEQMGLISQLGQWVLLTACRQAKAWLDAGIEPMQLGVNLSALQFKAPLRLDADIAAILAQTGLPPEQLELELTESVLMGASREHSDVLVRLRQSGVTITIDDFGTGYSSLDYLRRFPTNRIKIAQTFVRQLETRPGDAAIVKATIGLARELGIKVNAMGVESQAQVDLLKGWGCGEAQGFHFARPLSAENITPLLRDGRLLASEAPAMMAVAR